MYQRTFNNNHHLADIVTTEYLWKGLQLHVSKSMQYNHHLADIVTTELWESYGKSITFLKCNCSDMLTDVQRRKVWLLMQLASNTKIYHCLLSLSATRVTTQVITLFLQCVALSWFLKDRLAKRILFFIFQTKLMCPLHLIIVSDPRSDVSYIHWYSICKNV